MAWEKGKVKKNLSLLVLSPSLPQSSHPFFQLKNESCPFNFIKKRGRKGGEEEEEEVVESMSKEDHQEPRFNDVSPKEPLK